MTLSYEQKQKMLAGRRRAARQRERERKTRLERVCGKSTSTQPLAFWGGFGSLDGFIAAVVERNGGIPE